MWAVNRTRLTGGLIFLLYLIIKSSLKPLFLCIMEKLKVEDYQQRMSRLIDAGKSETGFPVPEDYGLTYKEVTDYLYDKQEALDSMGSPRSRYTLYGVLIVMPVIVASAFPEEQMLGGARWGLFVAIGIGLLLALLVTLLLNWVRHIKVRRVTDERMEEYLNAVEKFCSLH